MTLTELPPTRPVVCQVQPSRAATATSSGSSTAMQRRGGGARRLRRCDAKKRNGTTLDAWMAAEAHVPMAVPSGRSLAMAGIWPKSALGITHGARPTTKKHSRHEVGRAAPAVVSSARMDDGTCRVSYGVGTVRYGTVWPMADVVAKGGI
eukprot:1957652-Prymnesium_polylepis.1